MTEEQAYFSGHHRINIYALSEQSLTIEFGTVINKDLLDLITGFNQDLLHNPFPGFITTVPAYSTLTIFYNPLSVSVSDLIGETCYDKVCGYLKKIGQIKRKQSFAKADKVIIPVCYGGVYGQDIATVAQTNGITENEVIKKHASGLYTVFMIGFVPGFAYMGGMDDQLSTPRKAIPDAKIPAGAVGIAGSQTGIYPMETPGGWQIIGRTPLKMFDVNRSQPSLLKGGDEVSFRPIDIEEFNDYAANEYENQHH